MSQTPGTVDEDNLDGVTREELVRAQIAKHKELLAPEAPVVARLTAVNAAMISSVKVLSDIRDILHDILVEQQHLRNHLDPVQPTVAKDKKSEKISEAKT